MKKIATFLKKSVKVEGYAAMSMLMFILCTIASVLLFPPYAAAYGIAHLLKLNGREDMEDFKEWFAPVLSVMNGNAIIK